MEITSYGVDKNTFNFTHLWVDDFGWENTIFNSSDFPEVELLAETEKDGKVYLAIQENGKKRILKVDEKSI
jgi:hypothetical protein